MEFLEFDTSAYQTQKSSETAQEDSSSQDQERVIPESPILGKPEVYHPPGNQYSLRNRPQNSALRESYVNDGYSISSTPQQNSPSAAYVVS